MNRIVDTGVKFTTYRNLPPLAGLVERMSEAIETPGLAVEVVVSRLKRFHYALKRLHGIFISRIPSEPVYELKMAFSLHAHLCAEHVGAMRQRVGEMREPPLGLDKVPHPALERFFDEIQAAPTMPALLTAVYEMAVPSLISGLERHQAESHPLADHPSLRLGRFALLELREIATYGNAAVAALVDEATRDAIREWLAWLPSLLGEAGGLDGAEPGAAPMPRPELPWSGRPGPMNVQVRRDERFSDPYNMGVNAEAYLQAPCFDDASKVIMMFYKRLREIDVPEVMASIIGQTPDKPWAYYRDMTRQLWDEARHAMMGEVGFVSLGIDWTTVPINFTWSLTLNGQLTPIERHAVLYFIEQGLMPRTGKRHEWEVALASGHPLAALFQDFDWADEVLHAHIGRQWYVSQMPGAREAVDYGDACWSKIMLNWAAWKRDGLTEHRNWWPSVYRAACAQAGLPVRNDQLAYATSYESSRADLKPLPVE
ncbi:MAG: hypothetical protein ACKV19_07645 [Verrucomicrobiales bacterium]